MAPEKWPRPAREARSKRDPRYSDPQYGDPRYGDPRYGDPEYGDPQYRDPQYGDPRYGRSPYGDGRDRDGRGAPDPRLAAGRQAAGDPRFADPRYGRRQSARPASTADPQLTGDSRLTPDPRLLADPRLTPDSRFLADPRLTPDPRLTASPRLAADPRFAADPRLAHQRTTGPRDTDRRYPGPRHSDSRYADSRQADLRHADPGYADPRYADPGCADPRQAEPRYDDPRFADPRFADPRFNDPRFNDPRFAADPRYAPELSAPAVQAVRASDPWGRVLTGEAAVGRPLQGPPRAIENRRLAIEAPRPAGASSRDASSQDAGYGSDNVAAQTRHTEPGSNTDPLSRTDPLARTDPLGRNGPLKPTALPLSADRSGAAGGGAHVPDPSARGLHTGPHALGQNRAGTPMEIAEPLGLIGTQQQTGGARRSLGENTRSVRLPVPGPPGQRPLATPIYRTASFTFGSSAEFAAVLSDAAPGFSYSRIDNPTVEAFCAAVTSLESINLSYQAATQAFASGMAAISTAFWAFTRAGSHVIAPTATYGGSYSFLRNVASNFGVQTDFVDMTDLERVKAALRPGTSVVYAETLANPTVAVTDLASVARLAHEAGALFIVDSTLAPPVICRPLEHGADLVLHSATKYFGGHSDVTGGVITGHRDLIKRIRDIRIDTGGSLGPDDSYLLRRGLETLPLRVRRQCSTAQVLAAGLARHPAVARVYYPGLAQHPGHDLARRQFDAGPEGTRFGAIVTVAPYGGRDAGMIFADRMRVAQLASSLGGTQTKVSHVGSTTHRQMDAAALAAAGIDPASVRFSIGLEDGEDLLADAMAALDSLGGG